MGNHSYRSFEDFPPKFPEKHRNFDTPLDFKEIATIIELDDGKIYRKAQPIWW